VSEDGPKRPSDGNGGGKIAFGGGKGVSGSCALEEEAGEERLELEHRVGEKEERKTHRARKTKTFVQIPAPWVIAFTPKASKAVMTTRTVVHPW